MVSALVCLFDASATQRSRADLVSTRSPGRLKPSPWVGRCRLSPNFHPVPNQRPTHPCPTPHPHALQLIPYNSVPSSCSRPCSTRRLLSRRSARTTTGRSRSHPRQRSVTPRLPRSVELGLTLSLLVPSTVPSSARAGGPPSTVVLVWESVSALWRGCLDGRRPALVVRLG
jgi:hypothetical protein